MIVATTSQFINGTCHTILMLCTDEPYAPDNVGIIRHINESTRLNNL